MHPIPHQARWIAPVIRLTLAFLVSSPAVTIADESNVAEDIVSLTRNSRPRADEHTRLNFDTYHPQGMTRVGETWFMTSVKVLNRAEGVGEGHLFEFNDDGELLRSIELSDGPMYHPGGIDFDGKHIWVCVAEYRPDSNSVVYRVDPVTLEYEEAFRFNDHLGGIISAPTRNELIAVSWGSRRIYKWKTNNEGKVSNPVEPEVKPNATHFIDYQDGQWLKGTNLLVMGGLAGYKLDPRIGGDASIGGIGVIDAETLLPVFELPIPLYSGKGYIMNRNPFYVSQGERGISFAFIPDDNESTLYRYTFPVRKP